MTHVSIRRKTPTVISHNLRALMSSAIKNIISTHSTLDMSSKKFRQLAISIGYSLVNDGVRAMADEHLVVILRQVLSCLLQPPDR